MTLRDKLEADIREAMRRCDRARVDTLRYLKSVIQLAEKPQGKALDDPAMVEVVAKQVKERRESIKMFEQGSRADLAGKEAAELAVLEEYLPPQLSQNELVQLIQDVINEVEAKSIQDKGRVMGRLMPQVRGKADGAEVNSLVSKLMESSG